MNRVCCTARRLSSLILILAMMSTGQNSVRGQEIPEGQRLTPLGVRPGETTVVTVRGKNLKSATQLWTSCGVQGPLAGEPTQPDRADFSLTIPEDVVPGLHGCRVTAPGGASSLLLFLVDDLPTTAKADGNSTPLAAQAVNTPCAIDGRMENLGRDFYRFEAKAGQRFSFEVFARRLGSPLDPAIFLYRQDGRELDYADDTANLSGDCQLTHTFDADGIYILEVRDIRYAGGALHVYRLRIGDIPTVQTTYPLAIQRGTTTSVALVGTNADELTPHPLTVPADWPFSWLPVSDTRGDTVGNGFATMIVSDTPEVLEAEPNSTLAEANAVSLDQSFNGRFDSPGDVDLFRFRAAKGQKARFQGMTREQGSPADLVLRVLDATGKQLARADDNGTAEGRIDHTFAEEGEYLLEVTELLRRGGPQFVYRIAVSDLSPGFELALEGDTLNIPRKGGTTTVPIKVTRVAYTGEIAVKVDGLPAGVTAAPLVIGPAQNAGVLSLTSSNDFDATIATEVTVRGEAKVGEKTVQATASVASHLKTRWNLPLGVPAPVQESAFLASAVSQPLTLRVEPAEVTVPASGKATITVSVERGKGLGEEVTLATSPAADALPKGAALKLAPIPKGQSSVTLELSADDKVAKGTYSLVLTGVHKQGKTTTTVSSPGILFRIAPAAP